MHVFIGRRGKSILAFVAGLSAFTAVIFAGTGATIFAQPPQLPSDRQPIYASDEPASPPNTEPASGAPESLPARDASAAIEAAGDVEPADQSSAAEKLGASGYQAPLITADSASFNGVKPGKSDVDDVRRVWGEPANVFRLRGADRYVYAVKPFRRIEVEIKDDRVRSIMIHFEDPFAPNALAAKLKLTEFRPVEICDETGEPLGRAYPERGVLLSYSPKADKPEVTHILLESIGPEAFILRAQLNLAGPCGDNLADLDYALQLAPNSAEAHHVRAQVLLVAGQSELARRACLEALRLDPTRRACRLTLAECLFDQGRYNQALAEIHTVESSEDLPKLLAAQALLLKGELLARGPTRDFAASLKLHMKAIETASPLSKGRLPAQRRAAKQVLLEAHLGVARSIGRGNWQRKPTVVRKWLTRAEAIANDLIENEQASLRLRLLVAEYALYAQAGFKSDSPEIVAENAQKIADELIADDDDPLWQAAIRWQLGRTYGFALQIEHFRDEAEAGLRYGEAAVAELQAALAVRELSPRAQSQLGRLYAGVGAMCAVHHGRHAQAVTYYEKALPLLRGVPSQAAAAGRLGETLVSMGVSYWEIDRRARALELTEQGAELIAAAVQEGALASSSLAVPYSNLASMHEQLGDPQRAANFAELATKSQQTVRK